MSSKCLSLGSVSINRQDVSHSFNTQMDSLIPASKISTLTQGMFVGAVSDNFDERIEQKIFHAEIVVDNEAVKQEFIVFKKNKKRCHERKKLHFSSQHLFSM